MPRDDRVEDYVELREFGLTREQAAERLGVTMRTIWRYEAILRGGPRPPTSAGRPDRLRRFADLRSQGRSIPGAARSIGVTTRTGYRYAAALTRLYTTPPDREVTHG